MANWINGFVPIKCDAWLKTSSLNNDVKLTAKWISKKMIRKSADSAMANFLAIDEDKIPLILNINF